MATATIVREAGEDFPVVCIFQTRTNDSAAKNYAAAQTDSPWLLFLDDSVEAIDPDWLTIMAEHVQRPEVGASRRAIDSIRMARLSTLVLFLA